MVRGVLNDSTLRDSLFASLEIAVLSMIAGMILGTMLAIGLVRSRAKWSGGANILMLSRWSCPRSWPASRRC